MVQKNYAFSIFFHSTGKCATKCKAKGIILNYENATVVNLNKLRYMILENALPVHGHNPRMINSKHGGKVV